MEQGQHNFNQLQKWNLEFQHMSVSTLMTYLLVKFGFHKVLFQDF